MKKNKRNINKIIVNSQMLIVRKGFTLVELLISLAISGIIATVILSILFTTLRVSKKSDLLVVLKNNGSNASSQIAKTIRYAKALDAPSTCVSPVITSSITVTSFVDNGKTTFTCTTGDPATITSNGESLIDLSTASISNCSFTCSQPTLSDPPTIYFTFVLSSKNSNNLVEATASIPFQTSVTLRNNNQ